MQAVNYNPPPFSAPIYEDDEQSKVLQALVSDKWATCKQIYENQAHYLNGRVPFRTSLEAFKKWVNNRDIRCRYVGGNKGGTKLINIGHLNHELNEYFRYRGGQTHICEFPTKCAHPGGHNRNN